MELGYQVMCKNFRSPYLRAQNDDDDDDDIYCILIIS